MREVRITWQTTVQVEDEERLPKVGENFDVSNDELSYLSVKVVEVEKEDDE